ncbi:hypothetical protein CVT26_001541 [Gymnopilus dilepis]|uniref:Uncharacterized protein n=1 Tax=Gymnopilus dilepis TaxID=231916 RepID=A0A409WVV3_9AGAR|nr:hypothetical protein CVT26_001541 [Gymnopilus dilepis]
MVMGAVDDAELERRQNMEERVGKGKTYLAPNQPELSELPEHSGEANMRDIEWLQRMEQGGIVKDGFWRGHVLESCAAAQEKLVGRACVFVVAQKGSWTDTTREAKSMRHFYDASAAPCYMQMGRIYTYLRREGEYCIGTGAEEKATGEKNHLGLAETKREALNIPSRKTR